jgi:cell division protein FtsB
MFNPPISDLHTSFDDVSRLLALIADPAAHRARLEELVKQEAATKAEIAALNAMKSETLRLHQTAQATNIVADRRIAALDAREAEIEQRAEQLQRSEVTKSDEGLRRRESMVEAREKAARAEAESLAATRKELDAKLVKFRNFSSSL